VTLVLQVLLLVLLPLGWGLAVEFAFEWARRRRSAAAGKNVGPYDWVI
jgi:hypothetical protein